MTAPAHLGPSPLLGRPAAKGAGPHIQGRPAWPPCTGRSLRSQTRSKAGATNAVVGVGEGSGAICGPGTGTLYPAIPPHIATRPYGSSACKAASNCGPCVLSK